MPRKKKSEITVPKARLLPSGRWFIQLRIDGKSISVTEDTEAKCRAKALAIKAGYVNAPVKEKAAPTLGECIDLYIEHDGYKSKALSPTTVRSFESYRRYRFQAYMDKPADSIDYQAMINEEARTWFYAVRNGKESIQVSGKTKGECERKALKVMEGLPPAKKKRATPKAYKLTAKSLRNAWGLAAAALKAQKIPMHQVSIDGRASSPRNFLDFEQIPQFMSAMRGDSCEIPALMGLCSLRMSEIKGLTWGDIDLENKTICVNGSMVYGKDHKLIYKDENKTDSSTRYVPITIPRLTELLEAVPNKTGYVVPQTGATIYGHIRKACDGLGLPVMGAHSMRHSYASLTYHLKIDEKRAAKIGGWKDEGTMRKIYQHIARKDIQAGIEDISRFYEEQNANKNANEK